MGKTNGWSEAIEAKDVSAAPLKPEFGSAAGSASAPVRSLAASSSAPLISLGSPAPSRPGSRGAGMPSPEKAKGWTPKDSTKKKMDAAEMARRSDAFWASVEQEIGTGTGASGSANKTSGTSLRRGSSTGASKMQTKKR